MAKNWKVGDLVWAKMKSYSPWPGRVSQAPSYLKRPRTMKNVFCIYFFGTRNYAYIEEFNIKDYEEYKPRFANFCKSLSFKEACRKIADFSKIQKEQPDIEPEHLEEDGSDALFNSIKETDLNDSSVKESEVEEVEKITPKKKKIISTGTKRLSTHTPKVSSAKKVKSSSSILSDENGLDSPSTSTNVTKNYEELLNRPTVDRPKTPTLDLNHVSETLINKNIEASNLTFGFIGLGLMGSGIVKNLINSGHKVNLWNRTLAKAEEVKRQAEEKHPDQVQVFSVPCDVVQNSNITFCCVSDARVAKELVFGNCGVLRTDDGNLQDKGFVQLTSIDADTSKDISNEITSRGGRYLEAQLQGSKQEADEGSLIVLGAGDHNLFADCQTCFKAMGKIAFYLGDVGNAANMNLTLQVMTGVALAGLAEGFALADRSGLAPRDVMEIFSITPMNSKYLVDKAKIIVNTDFANPRMPLQHMQKDLKLALELADSLPQPLLMTATANEVYKHARRLGYEKHDAAAVYMRTRH